MYQLKQQDIEILYQPIKTLSVHIELLNSTMVTIDTLEGELIDGNCNIDSGSPTRRTCKLSFHVKDSTYLTDEKSKIWLDKYIRISIGMLHQRTQEIFLYPLGIFMFNKNGYQYNLESTSLSIDCVDLMGKLNGTRNGQVGALTTKIPAGSNIRNAMISAIEQLGFVKKYLIDDIGAEYGDSNIYTDLKYNEVPYDLQFNAGCTVYEIVEKLKDLYAGWEVFFDTDGTFVCQKVPSGSTEPVVLNTDILSDEIVIDESYSNQFDAVKNTTEVWGKCIEVDRFSDICTLSGNQYSVTMNNIPTLDNYLVLGIKINAKNPQNSVIKINSLTACPIVDSTGESIAPNTLEADTVYTFKYLNSKFYYLGQFQVHAIFKDENPDSPFNVTKLGEILDVKAGGDYEKIYSDDLALQRAEYENYLTTRLQDVITLNAVLIPWLDVNQKIEYKSKITEQTNEWLIGKISFNFNDWKMSVQCIKYYPLYPVNF